MMKGMTFWGDGSLCSAEDLGTVWGRCEGSLRRRVSFPLDGRGAILACPRWRWAGEG